MKAEQKRGREALHRYMLDRDQETLEFLGNVAKVFGRRGSKTMSIVVGLLLRGTRSEKT